MSANKPPRHVEEYSLPSAEALLAGTLALMTGYAQHKEDCEIRPLMAGKLVRNLTALAAHPAISEPMKAMLTRLLEHWVRAAGLACEAKTQSPVSAWVHAAPAVVQ